MFLRKALLYWDVICWPRIQTLDMRMPFPEALARLGELPTANEPVMQLLSDEGCLIDYPVAVGSVQADLRPPQLSSSDMVKAHVDAYLNLEIREPGIWSLVQQSDQLGLPISVAPVTDGVVGRLANSLPAPRLDVSHLDVIQFRRRHRDAFLALRVGLDDLALAVVDSNSPHFAWEENRTRLESALVDLWKACAASKLKWYQSTLKVVIAALAGAVTGAATSKLTSSEFPTLSAGYLHRSFRCSSCGKRSAQ